MMDLDEIGWLLLLLLPIIDVVGYWVTLFLWIIPTLSIAITEIGTLTLWTIVAIPLFFFIWTPIMIVGAIFLAGIIFG